MTHRPRRRSQLTRLEFRFSERVSGGDFDVRAFLPQAEDIERIRERVTAALALVQRHSPVRYECLRRDLSRILVGAIHNFGECCEDAGICVLAYDYVVGDATSPERLALTLVHEGTHARLARAGFRYHEPSRARIERLCDRASLIVARRFGAPDAMVAEIEARLAWPPEMWTDEQVRERLIAALEDLGVPGRIGYWLGRIGSRIRR